MSDSRKASVVQALHALQERLTSAHLAGTATDGGELARDFNALLQLAKESFPQSDTLRLIEALGPDAGIPTLAVRLVMMRRTIEAEGDDIPATEHHGDERRRWQRRDVSWSAWFVVGEGAAVAARAVDASRHGLRLVLEGSAPTALAQGQKCGVEVRLADSSARFFRDAEVCHVDGRGGVGLAIADALPAGLVPPNGGARPPAGGSPQERGERATLRSRLLSLFGR